MATAKAAPTAARASRRQSARPSTAARASVAGSAVGAFALIAIVALVLAVVLAAAERPSFLSPFTSADYFPSWMAGPLAGLVPSLTRDDSDLRGLISAAIALGFAGYLVVLWQASNLRTGWIIAAIVAVQVILFLSPPLFSTDVFNYLNYGRMGVLHDLNPYTTIPLFEPHSDPTFAISNWHRLLSPYGPLFTLVTYALVPIGVAASFWTIKAIIALAFLATLALVWRCAELLGRSPRAAVVLVGLNPLVLVWGLGADHNDALMMLLVVLSLYLALLARDRAGSATPAAAAAAGRLAATSGAVLIAAVAVKASAGILVPVFLLAFGQRRAKCLGALAAAALLAIVSFAAFGLHVPGLGEQAKLVTPLGLPNVVGVLLGLGGETKGLHTVLDVVLIATVLAASFVTWRDPERGLGAAFACMLVLVLTLSWSGAWYVLWVLPFAALLPGWAARTCVLALSAFLILAFAPNEPLVHRPLSLPLYTTALGRAHNDQINALLH